MRQTVSIFLALVFLGACTKEIKPTPLVDEFEARPIAVQRLQIPTGAGSHVLELKGFRAESNPVLSVLDLRGTEITVASGGGGERSIRLPESLSGEYTVIVRARNFDAVDTTDLLLDGAVIASGLKFSAGTTVMPARATSIAGVRPPNGATSHVALQLSANGTRILQYSSGSHTSLRLTGAVGPIVYGSTVVGPIRTYVNESEDDADDDGLVDALEHLLNTCASNVDPKPGLNCASIADTRDTDGDGLMDGWEVFGVDTAAYGVPGGEFLPLATWGANPRHKDVFIEVDHRRLNAQETADDVFEHMEPDKARSFAATYADDATTDSVLREKHAASMSNPSGWPGLRVHLDTGVEPEQPSDFTIFGNWGGYNAVDPVPDPENPGSLIPASPGVWREEMAKSRHGIFHYVLGYPTGGGQCGYGVACEFNFDASGVGAHEFGHNLGLDHSGPFDVHEPNCKPNYPSLMNYAGTVQFSDGRDLGTFNNHALVETGAVNPGNEVLTRLETTYQYKIDAATGSVDWNRDNQFAPAGTRVRAYGNFAPGANCEFTREKEKDTGLESNRSPAIVRYNGNLWVFAVTTDGQLRFTLTPTPFICDEVDKCPELAFHVPAAHDVGPVDGIDAVTTTIAGRPIILLVGIRPNGTLFESWVEIVDGRYVWGGPIEFGSGASGEPSLAVSHDGKGVALAYRTRMEHVGFRLRSASGFGPEELIRANGQRLAMREASPALAYTYLRLPTAITAVNSERLLGAFSYGTIQLLTFNGSGRDWKGIGVPYDRMPPEQTEGYRRVVGRPSLAWVAPPEQQASRDGESHESPLPFTIGRVYVVYSYENQPVSGPSVRAHVRMSMSYVRPDGSVTIGLDSPFDNQWSYAYGIDLLQPGEIGLRAAETYWIEKPEAFRKVFVRPHADGISDLPYSNVDDWKVIAWGSCNSLMDERPEAMKVRCPEKSW